MANTYTIEDALILCGVNEDTNNVVANDQTAAQRIAEEVFNDNFTTLMDVTVIEMENAWKTYATLTINEGRIRLRPRTKANIKALLQ